MSTRTPTPSPTPYAAIPYEPNGMVDFLHHFPHIASSSNFDQQSSKYVASISLITVFFFLVFCGLIAYLCNVFYFRSPRKSFFRAIERNNVRASIVVLCALIITASGLGSGFGWRMSVNGLDGMLDDIDTMHTLSNNMLLAGESVVLGAQQLLTALDDEIPGCPDLAPIAASFNQTFLATALEYEDDTHALPDLLEDAKPKIHQGIRYVKACLLVPLLFSVVVSLFDIASTFSSSETVNRASRRVVIGAIVICGLVVCSQVAVTVLAGDFCDNPDVNAVNLIADTSGFNSTTHLTAQYYAFCEIDNPTSLKLIDMQSQLLDLKAQINTLNCTSVKNPRGTVMMRINICYSLAVGIMTLTQCSALHPVWVSLVETHFCDDTVVGIAWLWMDQMFCVIVMVGISLLCHNLMLSYRRSLAFSSKSVHRPVFDENTPLTTKSDGFAYSSATPQSTAVPVSGNGV
eukprot:c31_g1_i1.p1 GENE.c31_g1_i1~~c31_g1_i1.p1  ORF type:complete len:460 (-),score=78.90 c31_g1_i1:218-1597(-)